MKYHLQRLNKTKRLIKGLYKTLIQILIFDDSDEIEISLDLLNCLNILNTSGGYLTQTFNSQTLRGDL